MVVALSFTYKESWDYMESADKDKIKNCELLNQVLKIFSSRKTTFPKISPKKSPKKAFNYLETGHILVENTLDVYLKILLYPLL